MGTVVSRWCADREGVGGVNWLKRAGLSVLAEVGDGDGDDCRGADVVSGSNNCAHYGGGNRGKCSHHCEEVRQLPLRRYRSPADRRACEEHLTRLRNRLRASSTSGPIPQRDRQEPSLPTQRAAIREPPSPCDTSIGSLNLRFPRHRGTVTGHRGRGRRRRMRLGLLRVDCGQRRLELCGASTAPRWRATVDN